MEHTELLETGVLKVGGVSKIWIDGGGGEFSFKSLCRIYVESVVIDQIN